MNLCEALRFALTGREDPLPETPAELLNYSESSRAQLARELEGLPGSGRLPARGTEQRRRYDTVRRRLERWTAGAGRQRRSFEEARSGWRETRRTFFRRRFPSWAAMRRRGARMRLEARINYVPAKGGTADNRMRLMPAAGPGVYLNPEQIGEVLNLLTEEDDCEGAGEALLEHFAAEYGFLELIEALEENDVVGLKLWPDGDPEPP